MLESNSESPEILKQLVDLNKNNIRTFMLHVQDLDATMFMENDPESTQKNFTSIFADDTYECGNRVCRPHEAFPSQVPYYNQYGLAVKQLCFTNQTMKAAEVLFDTKNGIMLEQQKNIDNMLDMINDLQLPALLQALREQYILENNYRQVSGKINEFFEQVDEDVDDKAWGLKKTLLYCLGYYLRAFLNITLYGMRTLYELRANKTFMEFLTSLLKALNVFLKYDQQYNFQFHTVILQYALEIQMWTVSTVRYSMLGESLCKELSELVRQSGEIIQLLYEEAFPEGDDITILQQTVPQECSAIQLTYDSIMESYVKIKHKCITAAIADVLKLPQAQQEYIEQAVSQSDHNNCYYCIEHFVENFQPYRFRLINTLVRYIKMIFCEDVHSYLADLTCGDGTVFISNYLSAVKSMAIGSVKQMVPVISKMLDEYIKKDSKITDRDAAVGYIMNNLKMALIDIFDTDRQLQEADFDRVARTVLVITDEQYMRQKSALQQRIQILSQMLGQLEGMITQMQIIELQGVAKSENRVVPQQPSQDPLVAYFSDIASHNIIYDNFIHLHSRREREGEQIQCSGRIDSSDVYAIFGDSCNQKVPEFDELESSAKRVYIGVVDDEGIIRDVFPCFQKGSCVVGPWKAVSRYLDEGRKFMLFGTREHFWVMEEDACAVEMKHMVRMYYYDTAWDAPFLEGICKNNYLNQKRIMEACNTHQRLILATGPSPNDVYAVTPNARLYLSTAARPRFTRMLFDCGVVEEVSAAEDIASHEVIDAVLHFVLNCPELSDSVLGKCARTYTSAGNIEKFPDPVVRGQKIIGHYAGKFPGLEGLPKGAGVNIGAGWIGYIPVIRAVVYRRAAAQRMVSDGE